MYLKERPENGNKGTFGRALVIAGSYGMAGAATFAAKAVYRSGAGLCRVLTPEENRVIVQTAVPEALVTLYREDRPDPALIREAIDWATVILIGPGLSLSATAAFLLSEVRKESEKPVVYDADALNLLAKEEQSGVRFKENDVLTPHIGEFSRLTGLSRETVKADREKAASEFAAAHGGVLVLKDHVTLVAAKSFAPFLYEGNNSGMATGGSGDVLSGIITGLLATGHDAFSAAVLGVLLHGRAGEIARGALGAYSMMASDILDALPEAFMEREREQLWKKDSLNDY